MRKHRLVLFVVLFFFKTEPLRRLVVGYDHSVRIIIIYTLVRVVGLCSYNDVFSFNELLAKSSHVLVVGSEATTL